MEREMSTFADPTSDFAFKLIFANENKHILLDFLNTFLPDGEERVSDVELISPFLEKETDDDKLGIVDLLCTDKSGCKYVVEMQNAKIMAFDKRIEFYANRASILEENKCLDLFIKATDYKEIPEKANDAIKKAHEILWIAKFTENKRTEYLSSVCSKNKSEGLYEQGAIDGEARGRAAGITEGIRLERFCRKMKKNRHMTI